MADAEVDVNNNMRFLVEIDGLAATGFAEVTGLEAEIDVIEYREGGDNSETVRKVPGLVKVSDVTLKRGITADVSLWKWFKSVRDGSNDRRMVSVTLLDEQGKPVVRFRLKGAWPVKWEGPDLNGMGEAVAMETVVLTHDGLEVDAG